ncbi:MAG: hypothetical protein Q4D82_08580 [Neisseria sp.]|nr:hypothetical protein [Neisseria sp.]
MRGIIRFFNGAVNLVGTIASNRRSRQPLQNKACFQTASSSNAV